jgi:hypothetical protein
VIAHSVYIYIDAVSDLDRFCNVSACVSALRRASLLIAGRETLDRVWSVRLRRAIIAVVQFGTIDSDRSSFYTNSTVLNIPTSQGVFGRRTEKSRCCLSSATSDRLRSMSSSELNFSRTARIETNDVRAVFGSAFSSRDDD